MMPVNAPGQGSEEGGGGVDAVEADEPEAAQERGGVLAMMIATPMAWRHLGAFPRTSLREPGGSRRAAVIGHVCAYSRRCCPTARIGAWRE